MDREIKIYLRFSSGTTCINNQNPYRLPLQALKLYSTLQIKVLSFLTILGLKKKIQKTTNVLFFAVSLFFLVCSDVYSPAGYTSTQNTL